MVRGLYKLEFIMCLNSWFAWRLALDNVEQFQNSCVIVGLGQKRYAEKPIFYILLQSLYFLHWYQSVYRLFSGCSRCHRHILLVLNAFYASMICYEFLCTSHGLQWQVLILSISCLEINICCLYYMY